MPLRTCHVQLFPCRDLQDVLPIIVAWTTVHGERGGTRGNAAFCGLTGTRKRMAFYRYAVIRCISHKGSVRSSWDAARYFFRWEYANISLEIVLTESVNLL